MRNNPNWVESIRNRRIRVAGNWYLPASLQTELLSFVTHEIPNLPVMNFENHIAQVWVHVANQVQGRRAMILEVNSPGNRRQSNSSRRASQRALLSPEQR